jgi:hypothetical protein
LADRTAYIRNLEELVIPGLRAELEPLESGKTQTAKRSLGGPWIDTTQNNIRLLKEAIARYEAILSIERERSRLALPKANLPIEGDPELNPHLGRMRLRRQRRRRAAAKQPNR